MTFRHQPRWPPRPFALRPLPSYPRNPSYPRLPSVLPCRRPLNFQQLTRGLRFATPSEALCFQSLPTIKFCKPRVLITIRIAGGWGVSPRAGVKVILELRQAKRRGPSGIVYSHEGYNPGPSPLESTLTSQPSSVASKGLTSELTPLESTHMQKLGGGGRFSSFEFRFSSAANSGFKPCGGSGRGGSSSGLQRCRGTFAGCR